MMDLLLYTSIRDYIYARISGFMEQVLTRNLSLALTIVLALLTLWVMVQGYLIMSGRNQEGVKGFFTGFLKIISLLHLPLASPLVAALVFVYSLPTWLILSAISCMEITTLAANV